MSKYPELKFKVYEGEEAPTGVFEWGASRKEIFDRFYEAQEIEDAGSASFNLETILEDDPEFIDAYSSLGWMELDLFNYGNAFSFFMEGYSVGTAVIPKNYRGRIEWAHTENRPFLRVMQGVGVTYLNIEEWDRAIKVFADMLNYNPNDNQGVRALLMQCYIAQGKFKEILKLCDMFSDDTLPDILYGKVMACYRLEKQRDAEEALKAAIEFLPNIAKELLKKKHKQPKEYASDVVTVGGDDEAYDYWLRNGQYWTDPALLKFIEKGLKG